MKSFRLLIILFISCFIMVNYSYGNNFSIQGKITNEKFDKLVKESIQKINAQLKADLKDNNQLDQFIFDLRKNNHRCKTHEKSLNDNLKNLYIEPPQTIGYFIIYINYNRFDLLSAEALQEILKIETSEEVTPEKIERIKKIVSQIDNEYIKQVSDKVGVEVPYVFLSVYNFDCEEYEEGICSFVDGCDYFDVRLRPDLISEYESQVKAKIAGYTKERTELKDAQLCNTIAEEIRDVILVLREVKAYEKLKILHETNNADAVVSILESLFENQIHDFTSEQRLRLIKVLINSSPKEIEKAEAQLVRLFKFRPVSQATDIKVLILRDNLFPKLLTERKSLFGFGDNENYTNLIIELCKVTYDSELGRDNFKELAKNFPEDKIYKWRRESFGNRGCTITDEWNHNGVFASSQVTITSTYSWNHTCDFFNLKPPQNNTYTKNIDPFTGVGILFTGKVDESLFPGAIIGKIYAVPAFYLIYAQDKNVSNENKKKVFQTVEGVAIAVSLGELAAAKTGVQYFFAMLEISPTVIDGVLNIDAVQEAILSCGTSGQIFLSSWDDVKAIMQTAVILRGAQLILNSFCKKFDELKPQLQGKISDDQIKSIEDEIQKAKNKLEEQGIGITNTLPSVIRTLSIKPTYLPHRTIVSDPNKTTTIIGKWHDELSELFKVTSEEDLNVYLISGKFEHKGGFNLLSIENWGDLANVIEARGIKKGTIEFDDYIWENYNKGWIQSAMERGDEIVLWSNPQKEINLIKEFIDRSKGNTFFKRELDFIKENANKYGYNFENGIKGGIFKK